MKKITGIAILFLFISAVFSFGQSSVDNGIKKAKKDNRHIINAILKQQTATANKQVAAKTTTTYERCIAQSDYNRADTIDDTLSYIYNTGRGSYFNFNAMTYDDQYATAGAIIFGFGSEEGSLAHNDAPDLLCDTLKLWYLEPDTTGYSLQFYDLRASAYDSNNNVTDYMDLHSDPDTSYASYGDNRSISWFDSYTNISASMIMSLDMGAWDTSMYRVFFYDSTHTHIIKDSTNGYTAGSWSPTYKWVYTYNDSGHLAEADMYTAVTSTVTTTWQETQIVKLTYYPDNKVKTDTASYFTGVSWMPVAKDSFGYTSGISYATYYKTYYYSYGLETDYTVSTDHINGSGLPDTTYLSYYDDSTGVTIKVGKNVLTYDAYSNPEHSFEYLFIITDSTTWGGIYDSIRNAATYYYYEYFIPTSGFYHEAVSNTQLPATIKVYPNPATSQLNIYMPDVAKGAYTQVKLVNAAGQTVRTESLPWLNETESISTGGLTPGMYWLIINDRGGNTVYKQAIVKE